MIQAKVVMLPRIDKELALDVVQAYKEQETSLKAHNLITPSFVTIGNGLIKSITGELANVSYHPYNIREWIAQHLYFTTDEPIKDCWYIGNGKLQHTRNSYRSEGDKKVVASTEIKYELPAIPQSFLQDYVKADGKIDSVWLEVYNHDDCPEEMQSHPFSESTWYQTFVGKLKLTDNNEVIVVNGTDEVVNALEQDGIEVIKYNTDPVLIDKELKDDYLCKVCGAESCGHRPMYEFSDKDLNKDLNQVAEDYGNVFFKNAVIYGAQWQQAKNKAAEEKLANDTIKMLEWIVKESFYKTFQSYGDTQWKNQFNHRITSKQLYELWQKNK